MKNLEKFIKIKDELNLFLVSEGIKPAAKIRLNLNFHGRRFENSEVYQREFEKILKSLGIPYRFNEKDEEKTISVYVAKDERNLKVLLHAKNAKSDNDLGRAYGYPEEAIRLFDKIEDGKMGSGQYLDIALSKAKREKVGIPTWLAYISHVPEKLDIVEGKISRSSKELGESYMKFVRKYNPGLAKRIEQNFHEKKIIATKWDKTPNGSYKVTYERRK